MSIELIILPFISWAEFPGDHHADCRSGTEVISTCSDGKTEIYIHLNLLDTLYTLEYATPGGPLYTNITVLYRP